MSLLRLTIAAVLLAGTATAAPLDLAVGPLAGATSLDPQLADYRWDTSPRLEAGLESTVGRGRWRLGLRLLRSETTQGTGLGTGYDDPVVRLTSGEAVGRYRVAAPLGVEVWAGAHAGWLHLGYTPDALAITPGAGLDPVNVDFAPVNEAVLGGGLELRRPLGRSWALALAADASTFALDTSHRRGDEIVRQRQRFWNGSARLAVTWRTDLGR
jgi:hypothetical protein